MTEITLKLTFEELKQIDKFVELNDETRLLFDKIRNAYPKPETLLDVIRNLGYSYDMCYEIVDAVEEFEKSKEKEMIKRNLKTSLQEMVNGDVRPIDDVVNEAKEPEKWDVVRESVKWCEEHPDENPLDWVKPREPEDWDIKVETDYLTGKARHKTKIVDKDGNDYKPKPYTIEELLKPKTPEETEKSLREAFVKAQQTEEWKETQRKIDEEDNDKNFKNSLDLIREWGEKNKPPTLKELLWEWWEDIFTRNSDLDADASIDYLVDILDKKFIPPSHDTNDYQWNKCLKIMRDKLR